MDKQTLYLGQMGVTIVELLIVITVMGIISAFGYVAVDTIIDNTRAKADIHNLDTLNKATENFITYGNIDTEDAFEGLNSDYFRIEHLHQTGYLDTIIETQQNDAEFRWNVDNQTWELYGGRNPYNTYQSYDFSTMTLQDAIDDGLTVVTESRLDYDTENGHAVILRQGGMMFKDTTQDAYSFSVVISTQNQNDTRPVFYFDYNDANDNLAKGEGFAILFNRKNAFVRIFTISNGTSYSNATTFYYSSTGVIPTVNEDPSWYSNQHEFSFEISRVDSTTKQISIYIDGAYLRTFTYTRSQDNEQVYYGPNVRGNGSEIYIHDFD